MSYYINQDDGTYVYSRGTYNVSVKVTAYLTFEVPDPSDEDDIQDCISEYIDCDFDYEVTDVEEV